MICILLVAGHDTVLETQIKVCLWNIVAKGLTWIVVKGGSKFAFLTGDLANQRASFNELIF